jgi:LuxR family maltose regulon positive regulatory protein
MSITLLRTKLLVPPVRPGARRVPRPRLFERLHAGSHCKLTLISAPAGFGKTTLLGEWIASDDGPERVAWLMLDGEDNDPALFWSYVSAALQTIIPSLGEYPLNIETAVPDLINAIIAADPETFMLILDDFHAITMPQINDEMARLLDNTPPQMHLVLCGRADPPWSFARLRARGEMIELRAEELRFTPQEVSIFLNQVMGLTLSAESIAILDRRTEGWIAGLQLAAISMQGRDANAFIRDLSGSHRYIMDFLVEEVLEQQPAEIRAFLLQTSILEHLSASLCDAALGRSDSERILSRLERSNLFLTRLDDERRWYRYHHLFSDLLRSRLDKVPDDQLVRIHHRASEWYLQNGRLTQAVSHLLAAGEIEQVARLVQGKAMALVEHGELKSLIRRLEVLPDDVYRSHPWLCIAFAWLLSYAGRVEGIERFLQQAEEGLDGAEEWAEAQSIRGRIAHLRGYIADLEGDVPLALQFSRQALEQIAEDDLSLRAYIWSDVGTALRKMGSLKDAAEAFDRALALGRAIGDSHIAVMVHGRLGTLHVWRGQLRRAEAACQDALSICRQHAERKGQPLPTAGYAHIQMSRVLYERNELDAAAHHARQGIELCQRWGQSDLRGFGTYHLARILFRQGDLDGLYETSQKHDQIAGALPALFSASAAELELMYRLASGDLAGAYRFSQEQGMGATEELPLDQYHHRFTYIRLLNVMGKYDESLHLLARLLDIAKETGAWGYVLELWALQGPALEAKGERDRALSSLERALYLAEPEGYVSPFITTGAPIGGLLRAAADRGIAVDYALELLAAVNAASPEAGDAVLLPVRSSLPVDTLTEREVQVLHLLASELSTTKIAAELVISINTLRTHTKRIYGKLDVHSRLQAVAQARELGLL